MADIQQLERALVKADAAGDQDAARAFAAEIRRMRTAGPAAAVPPEAKPKPAPDAREQAAVDRFGQGAVDTMKAINQQVGNIGGGMLRGAGSIASTILYPIDKATDLIKGDRGPNIKGLITGEKVLSRNEQRRKNMDVGLSHAGVETDSIGYGAGKLTGEIAGTAGTGGVLGNGLLRAAPVLTRLGASAPAIANAANALTTSGFRAGDAVGAGKVALRVGGGAATGAAAAAMADPKNALAGGAIGGVLPPALSGAGKLAGYAGRSLASVVQPFTTKGQDAIAGKIVRKFAEGGPTNINAAQLVPGSTPTLAEATGNAGIAGLQRGARDLNPNAFVAREEANAAARLAAFDDVAGDAGKLEFFRQSRSQTAKELYEEALKADTRANFTPYVKGQITQLLKRPSIHEARKQAQKWAIERGEKASFDGNMRGLHDMKLALDDEIEVATRAGKGGQAKALEATQAKLVDTMEKLSPAYKEARLTYAAQSKPVNAMEALQGLKLTDAKGNITLQKVKSAIESLERSQNGVGISTAKSVDAEQIKALKAIHADLLRQSNLGLGKSAGSNTFQNIATNNMLATFMPGKLGEVVGGKVGGVLGQVGRLAYSGPNDAIRNRLAEIMLDPTLARNALNPAPRIGNPRFNALLGAAAPSGYRAAPLLSSDQ